jgi:group I intron endonuclease
MKVKTPGIYKIENKITGDFYIGSTVCLCRRKTSHFRNFEKGNCNKLMLEAIRNYGIKYMEFSIIEEIFFNDSLSKDYIDEYLESLEEYYIDKLKPTYNIYTRTVRSKRGEINWNTIKKLQEFNTGRKQKSFNANCKPIVMITSQGIRMKYKSIKECCKENDLIESSVTRTLKGLHKQHQGYKFEFQ